MVRRKCLRALCPGRLVSHGERLNRGDWTSMAVAEILARPFERARGGVSVGRTSSAPSQERSRGPMCATKLTSCPCCAVPMGDPV